MKRFDAYAVTNTVNGKRYIGVTSRGLAKRWVRHLRAATQGEKTPLHRAIRKYGADSFVVEHLASARSWRDLLLLELALIEQHGTFGGGGYNATRGGQGSFGHRHPQEVRDRIAKAKIGKSATAGTRAKLSAWQRHRTLSDAHRENIKKAMAVRYSDDPNERARLEQMSKKRMANGAANRAKGLTGKSQYADDLAARPSRCGSAWTRSLESRENMRKARREFLAKNGTAAKELAGKLTAEQVAEIKALLLQGRKQTEIAPLFGVGYTQISNIACGRSWREVEPARLATPPQP